jgi:hypothetical protein
MAHGIGPETGFQHRSCRDRDDHSQRRPDRLRPVFLLMNADRNRMKRGQCISVSCRAPGEATTAADTQKYSLSPPYAAPERWRAERATVAVDIYCHYARLLLMTDRPAEALQLARIQNRSRTSAVALKSDAAAEKSKDQLSRAFPGRSIFDFCNNIP